MQGTRFIEGMSFTHMKKILTFPKTLQVQGLRLLSVQNCEDVHFLFAILMGTTNLKRLRIHFNTKCDNYLATQHIFHTDMKRIAKNHLEKLSILEIFEGRISRSLPFD